MKLPEWKTCVSCGDVKTQSDQCAECGRSIKPISKNIERIKNGNLQITKV